MSPHESKLYENGQLERLYLPGGARNSSYWYLHEHTTCQKDIALHVLRKQYPGSSKLDSRLG